MRNVFYDEGRKVFAALILFAASFSAIAQSTIRSGNAPGAVAQRTGVSGVVTSETGEALPGVSVQVKGGLAGAATDASGRFNLTADKNQVLVFTLIGYVAKEVKLTGQRNLGITLNKDAKVLDQVVVVGYGTQRKKDVTGAVSTVRFDNDISSRPTTEFGQALYGKAAGVQVLTGTGRPGSSTSVQIRGINSVSAGSSPLIVIDGVPTPYYDLNLINSADIESIDILKDASSSAIYGSRGANGVILVTTKSGRSGAAKLNINYSTGIQKVIDKIPVMNAAEYAQAARDAAQNGWLESGGDLNAPNTIAARGQYKYTWPVALDNPSTLTNTDWQDVIFQTAPINKVDLSMSGGNDKGRFFVSGSYIKQKGIVITSDYKKYAFNVKASSKVKSWLEIGRGLSLNNDEEKEPFNRIVEWAVQYPAIYPVYGKNGYLGAPLTTDGYENYNAILFRPQNGHPLYRITDDIQHKRFNALGNMFGNLNLLPGLKFRSVFNLYYNRVDNTNYQAMDHNLGRNYYTEGIMTVNQNRTTNYIFQNLLTYDKRIGENTFSALAGFEYNNNNLYSTTQERRGYDNDLVHALSAGRTVFRAEDVITEAALVSYFSRINYTYKDRYNVSASLRRDGSSRFGPNNKWGIFPSLSAGWILSKEGFLSNIRQISNLKIRASYGLTGNDRFADYRWIGSMAQARTAFGSNLSTTYYTSGVTNRELQWERTKQFNIGLDLALFNSRILLEGDYYVSTSDGLLLDAPVPSTSGFTSVFQNIGKLQNKGVELNLTTRNLTSRLEWTTQFTFSRNRNEILALGPDNAPIIFTPAVFSGMQKINQVGQAVYSFYGYKYAGVYKNQKEIDDDPAHYPTATPGDGRYEDVNKDGVLNAADRTIIGNYNPDFIWGVTNNFRYKNFDLSFLFQGIQGNHVLDENIHRALLYHEGRNYYKEDVNRWRSEQEPGDGYHYKLTVNIDGYEKTGSSFWIRDGSYFRLKSLTLGYNLPQALLNRIKLGSARVYFNGLNLFTHKKMPIYDPEGFSGEAGDATKLGVSSDPYPSAKVYTFGINVGF